MTHKQIDAARELRLWISQVIIPAVGIAGVAMMKPETREAVTAKVREVKNNIEAKFTKK